MTDHEIQEVDSLLAELARTTVERDSARQALAQQQRAVEAERAARQRAQADNAALRELARKYGTHQDGCEWWSHRSCTCALTPVFTDHPGTPFLTELDAARIVVREARSAVRRGLLTQALREAVEGHLSLVLSIAGEMPAED